MRHLFTIITILAAWGLQTASAEDTYYDITSHYVQNGGFDANFDYDAQATGNTVNDVRQIAGWDKNTTTAAMAVVATFQYGTQKTFYDMSIPAAGEDGDTQGGCVAMCAAFTNALTYSQSLQLPAGRYKLVAAFYNCNPDATAGGSMVGWLPDGGEPATSTLEAFPSGQWTTDTISFEVTSLQSGTLRLGFRAASGLIAASAMVAIDYVKLLRDKPFSDENDTTGDLPDVVTDKRFARGATMAFGRMTATIGNGQITERGFCWSQQPHPTIADHTTTETLSNAGTIYVLNHLEPATKYYMRAYARTAGRRVAYGDVIKFYTLPRGNITYSYNNGGDAAANKRVNDAATEACNIFNSLTSIRKHYNIGYSAGTPTADCNYQDEPWMNMGGNASYQRTGTIMHEMQHGLGLVPYSTQWNKNILRERLDGNGRGTGHWLGDRVSALLDFWDNTKGSQLNGDYQHMWPYGINGASEDNGTLELYYANALIGQALGEDGLEHRSSTFADPCYIFDQEDTIRYYLKCEDEERGFYDSYLVPTATGTLRWQAMTNAEAQANDSAAWYVTFTPANQYYQLRNAATGEYLTYQGSFRTMAREANVAADNFHLMRGRTDVGTGENALRGYWLVHPTGNLSPNCMQANAGGSVGSATFDLRNTATRQRWLILTADEMQHIEQAAIAGLKGQLSDVLADIRPLASVPHTEVRAGADADFLAAISSIDERADKATTAAELLPLADEARQAAYAFLCSVSATDEQQPFDLSYMIADRGMDAVEAWNGSPALSYSCAEFYEKTFDFYQSLSQLPAGSYRLCAQGFQRPGSYTDAYNAYAAGNNGVTAWLYAGSSSTRLAHIATEARSTKLGGSEASVGSGLYVPDNMQAASIYFANGLYDNELPFTMATNGEAIRIGLRSQTMQSRYWCIFDNFRLFFLGQTGGEEQGISDVARQPGQAERIADLQGRCCDRSALKQGIYIIDGRKVVVR